MVKMKNGRMPAGMEPKINDVATQLAAPMMRLRIRLIIELPVEELCENQNIRLILGQMSKR